MTFDEFVKKYISTHTLTWSVTLSCRMSYFLRTISTHTLTWSVTGAKMHAHISTKNFNSHAHVERDHVAIATGEGNTISTHTLTWSVTF